MKDPKDLPPDLTDLRRRAEEQLAAEAISPEELSPAEAARLIHELRVHQIELEMQNEELRLSQTRLEESRSKYADLYDFAPVGYLTLDPGGKIVEANLTAATLLGVERSKLLDRFFAHFLVEADRRVFRQLLNNGLNQQERRGEFHLKDGNGDVRIMLLDILFLMDAEGRERCRINMTDITEFKRTQAELIETNERLREANDNLEALFAAAPLAIGVFDAEGKILQVNPASERIFGWSLEELKGRLRLSMPTDAPEESLGVLQRLLQGESFVGAEIKQQRQDGSLIDVSFSAAPLYDAQGNPRGFIGLAEDITERKKLEGAARTQAKVLESMAEGVAVTDARGQIVYTNPAFDAMFGYKTGELLGHHSNILNFHPPEENAALVKDILRSVEITGVWAGELHNCRKNGKLFYTFARISAVEAGGKKLFISVQEDITRRRRAEETLRRQAELLDLAHDAVLVRNPKGRIMYWNQGAASCYGWSTEAALGQSSHKLLKTAFPQPQKEIERHLMEHGYWEGELVHTTRQGKHLVMSSRWSVKRDEKGSVAAILEIHRDITAQKQIEKEVHRLASFPLLNPNPVLEVDEDGQIVYSNPAARRIAGNLRLAEGEKAFLPPNFQEIFAAARQGGPREYSFDMRVKEAVFAVSLHLPHDLPTARLYLMDITERKRAEEALRESEGRLSAILENMPVGIWIVDSTGRVTLKNKAADLIWAGNCPLSSLPEDYVEYLASDVKTGKPLKTEDYPLARTLRTGLSVEPVELRIRRFDGKEGFIMMSTALLRGPDGSVTGAVGINVDITERKRAEAALQESEARLRLALDAAYVISFEWDIRQNQVRRFTSTDPTLAPTPEQAPSTFEAVRQAVHPEDRELFTANVLAALSSEDGRYENEFRIVHLDGEVAWLYERGYAERDEQGRPARLIGLSQDITERKRAEEELARQKKLLQKIVDNIPVMLTLYDPNLHTFSFNQEFRKVLGWTEEDMDMNEPMELFYPDPRYREEVRQYMESLESGWRDFRVTAKDGAIVDSTWANIRLTDDTQIGIGVDVRERKQAEAALRESREDLNRAQAVAHVGSWRMNVQKNELTWSEENHRIFGIPSGTPLTYESFLGTVHPEDREYVDRKWMAALQGEPYDIEHRIVVEGQVKWVRERAGLEFDQEGRLLGGFGMTQDITGRKEMEEALRRAHDQLEQRVAERTAALRLANEQLVWEIEERQQAESRLRESEARFAAFMEHLPGLAVMRDIQGRYLFANHAWEKMMGLEPGAWKGKTLTEVWPADQANVLEKLDFEVISSGKPIEKVEMLELAAGPRYFLTNVFPIGGREGLSYMIGGIAIDVTARQEAEEALAEYAAQVHDLYNHAPCGYHSLDSESAIVQINDTELAWLGYTREEVVGRLKFPDLLTPASQKVFREIFPGFKARGFVKDLEYEMVRKDGTILPVSLSATVVRDEAGNYVMSRGTIYDITDRKRAEEALKEKEAMLRLILDTLPVGVWVTDREGRIVQGNPAAQRIWKGARYVGIDDYGDYQGWWADSGKKIEPQEWALARAVQKGETSLGEVVNIQCFDGSRKTIINSAVPLFGEKHDILGAIVVNQDITAMVRAEEVMQEQARQLEAFFAHSLTPFVFLDSHFNFLRVNEAYARACQRHVQDFIGHNHFEFYPHAENQAIFNEVVRTKIPFQVQAKAFEFPDHPEWGVTYWDWSLAPMLDQAGEVDFLVFSLRDVTRRVLSEQARNRLIEILEATPDFVGIADYYGNLQYLNRAGRAMVGVGEDEDVSSLKVLDLHPERIGNLILREGSQTAMREGAWQAELALLHRDGREIPVSQVILAHKDPSGRVGFFSTVARDISEMKQAQESILRQTAILNCINRIFREALTCETREDLGQTCLSMAEALTDSRFGFIDLLNEDGSLDFLAVSDPARETCRQAGKEGSKLPGHVSCRGIFQGVIKKGASLITNAPASHPDWRGLPEGHPPLASYLGVPLKHGRQVMGQIGLGNRESGYSKREQEAVETLAPAIMEALMHRRAEEALMASERRLRYLADQLLTAQENERKRLAAELHDELGHALLTLKLSLSSVARDLLPEQEMLREEIKAQLAYINEVIGEVRRLYHDLSPGDVDDLGLTLALQALVENFAVLQEHLTCEADLPPLDRLFPLPVQTIIYRIVQEALTNIGKHADPEHVTVSARVEGSQVHFTVQDDGRGFDVSQVLGAPSCGIGLAAMEERLNMLGGCFEIHSRERVGTKLCFTVPIHKLDP